MKEKWINIAKLLAILAVMVDHTNGTLYTNQNIAFASYFSVSLFIFTMRITTVWSYSNSKEILARKVWRRIIGIFVPYCVAVFVYTIVAFRQFDLMIALQYLVNFNITGPHYYVLLYIQLLLASPILYSLVRWTRRSPLKTEIGEILIGGGYFAFVRMDDKSLKPVRSVWRRRDAFGRNLSFSLLCRNGIRCAL